MAATDGSVSLWLNRLKAGDRAGAGVLWQKYFTRLVGLSRRWLEGIPDRAADAEDVALSAMHSFCRRAEQHLGAAEMVADRDGLWCLLCDIAHNKVRTLWRKALSLKRGGGKLARAAELSEHDGEDEFIARQMSREPTPEEATLLAEEVSGLLGRLEEDERSIALLKLDGYSNEEIRERMGIGLSTVERKLQTIRRKWRAVS